MAVALTDGGPFILLASYPKSGNTWMRALLSNLLRSDEFALDRLLAKPIFASRDLFDETLGVSSADLRLDEIDRLRPDFHRALAADAREPEFVKVHDIWYRTERDEPVFSPDSCRGVVLIVRHPAAVARSLAFFRSEPVENALARMARADEKLSWRSDAIDVLLPQRIGSWSTHTASWLEQPLLPVLTVRYENLSRDTAGELCRVLKFAGMAADRGAIRQSVEQSRFDKLRDLESASGFSERPANIGQFFRRGEADSWRQELSEDQIRRVVEEHGPTMRLLGYPT